MRHPPCSLIPVLLLLLSSTASAVEIKGPNEVEAGHCAWFEIAGIDEGMAVCFFPDEMLDVDSRHIKKGHGLFWTEQPGKYRITAIAVRPGTETTPMELIPMIHRVTVTGKSPDPEPDPDPDPDPDPAPDPDPQPGRRRVVILHESNQPSPEFSNLRVRLRKSPYLASQRHELYILDQHSRNASDAQLRLVTKYMSLLDANPSFPVFFVADLSDKVLHQGPCPKTVAKVVELVKQEGG